MEKEKLCLRCMRKIGNNTVCPYCKDESRVERDEESLPVKALVGGRYLIGKAVSSNSEGFTYNAFDMKNKTPVTIRELFPVGMLTRGEGNYCLVNVGKVSEFVDIKDEFKKLWQNVAAIQGFNALVPVYDVIEDLALRGCNSLLVWFDMHHFESMEDAGAQALVKRLREVLGYANKIGIGGSLTMISNEGFSSSPKHLRAEWQVQNGYHAEPDSHYHVEICPSKEGGIEEILRARRAMLEYFADLKIDYVVYWPYDQGGCTCKDCAPWGSNGFLKLLPHLYLRYDQIR
jgi:hypothetical protein